MITASSLQLRQLSQRQRQQSSLLLRQWSSASRLLQAAPPVAEFVRPLQLTRAERWRHEGSLHMRASWSSFRQCLLPSAQRHSCGRDHGAHFGKGRAPFFSLLVATCCAFQHLLISVCWASLDPNVFSEPFRTCACQ